MSIHASRIRSYRQRAIDQGDRAAMRFQLWRNLGASIVGALALTTVFLVVPIYLQGLDPKAVIAEIVDVAPLDQGMLALEERSLSVEPAAPPLDHDLVRFCRRALAEAPRCEW